jgi:hypothetical protein
MKGFVITPRPREDIDIWYYIPDDSVEGGLTALSIILTRRWSGWRRIPAPAIGPKNWASSSVLSRPFVLDGLSARNETTADHPCSSCDAWHSDHAWHDRCQSHHRNAITLTSSYFTISLMTTLSPGCRPLLISISCTEVAPNCTGTFFAEWPSGSSLKSITRLLDRPNTGLPT